MRTDAASIYLKTGLVRRACLRGFWPLFFVRLVTEVELTPFQLVALGTVMELSILFGEVPTGVVADVYSRKWSVIISYLIVGAAAIASAFVSPYLLLVVAQIAMGIGNTFETGAETAWVTAEVGGPSAAEPIILRRGRLQLVAGVAGIVFFALLAAVTSLSISLACIGLVYLAWAGFLILRMPETNFVPSRGAGWSGLTSMLNGGFGEIRRHRVLAILTVAVLIGGLAKEAIDRLDVQRMVDVGLPSDIDVVLVIGAIAAANSLMAATFLFVAERRIVDSAVVPVMAALMAGVALGVVVLAQVDVLAIAALALVLQGGFFAATEPLVTTWTNAFAAERSRATIHSFIGQAEALGEIVGGLALGAVASASGVSAAMTGSAILFALSAAVILSARRHWTI